MKSTVYYKNDEVDVLEGAYPNFELEDEGDEPIVIFHDKDNTILTDDLLLEDIKRIVVELD